MTPIKAQVLRISAELELAGGLPCRGQCKPDVACRQFRGALLQRVYYGETDHCGAVEPRPVPPPKR